MVSLNAAEWLSVGLGGALMAVAGVMAYRAWKGSRITAEERERRRRAMLVAHGKMGDATLTEYHDNYLFYAYLVRGVEYTASQDVSTLLERVPSDLSVLSAVSVRYDPRNPANSIVVDEKWSGLHIGAGEAKPQRAAAENAETARRKLSGGSQN